MGIEDLYGVALVKPERGFVWVNIPLPWHRRLLYGAMEAAAVVGQALLFALAWTLMTYPMWTR